MSPLLTLVLLAAAFGLSWYSAHSAGRLWTESKIIGGMPRLMVVGSLVLSALGFTGVYFMLILLVLSLTNTPVSGLDLRSLFPISFGVLGAPGAGSVPNLWLNNQMAMRRQQMLGAAAGQAGAGLPADPTDVLDVALRSRGLWNWVGDLFKGGGDGGGDDDAGKLILVLIVIAVAILAICAGVVTTILIVQSADREHVSEIFDLYKAPGAAGS